MDARNARTGSLFLAICGLLFCVSQSANVLGQARSANIYKFATPNFVVHANNPDWARQVGAAAEANRRDLAMHWLGHELPQWSRPCPLMVIDHPSKPASGETKYTILPDKGAVVNFNMTVEGTRERIIDSVLPHEITHTIVASHFAPLGKTVPRWADEGMCTTVEHEAERRKHDAMLIRFLREGKGISFETLFALRDYPPDILPLYAQGYSLTSFLIAQGGPRQFIQFLERGMARDDWNNAIHSVYGYPLKGKLQTAWNDWVAEGGGDVSRFTAIARGLTSDVVLASSTSPAGNLAANSTERIAPTDNFVPASLSQAANLQSNSAGPRVNMAMHPSENSYYLQQLQKQIEADRPTEPVRTSGGYQHAVSQPGPLQTIGGGLIYR